MKVRLQHLWPASIVPGTSSLSTMPFPSIVENALPPRRYVTTEPPHPETGKPPNLLTGDNATKPLPPRDGTLPDRVAVAKCVPGKPIFSPHPPRRGTRRRHWRCEWDLGPGDQRPVACAAGRPALRPALDRGAALQDYQPTSLPPPRARARSSRLPSLALYAAPVAAPPPACLEKDHELGGVAVRLGSDPYAGPRRRRGRSPPVLHTADAAVFVGAGSVALTACSTPRLCVVVRAQPRAGHESSPAEGRPRAERPDAFQLRTMRVHIQRPGQFISRGSTEFQKARQLRRSSPGRPALSGRHRRVRRERQAGGPFKEALLASRYASFQPPRGRPGTGAPRLDRRCPPLGCT